MALARQRIAAQLASSHVHRFRSLSTTRIRHAAANFAMPAMSPTMTEGNIAHWKVAEGASFSAGDVILEIETDKATMDVEAQDDGVLAKILVAEGAKAVQVGTSIAVLAEPGDDLATLEMPEQIRPSESKIERTDSAVEEPSKPSETKQTNAPTPQVTAHGAFDKLRNADGSILLPSVIATLRKLGLTDIKGIKPTGPKGRLLKGDVLAFANKIDKAAPVQLQKEIEKRSKLDLSNIKKAAPPKPVQSESTATAEEMVEEEDKVVELTRPVDLSELILLAERLGAESRVTVSVEQLAAKAARQALKDIPAFGLAQRATADVLFDELVGASPSTATVYEPEPLAMPAERRTLDVNAAEYLEGAFIELPADAAATSVFSLQALDFAAEAQATPFDEDILDLLTDTAPMQQASAPLPAESATTVLASLHFREGSMDARTASLYLDRVSQYIESPVHLML